jgi:hypothetical protein
MKLKPDYKIFTFKRIPLFGEDDVGGAARVRPWAKIAVVVTVVLGWIYIFAYLL